MANNKLHSLEEIIKKVREDIFEKPSYMAVVESIDFMNGKTKIHGLIYYRKRHDGKPMLVLELQNDYVPVIYGGLAKSYKLIGLELHHPENNLFKKYGIRAY